MNIDKLNDWEESCCMSCENRPQWFKLWADKYIDALDIINLDKDLTPEQKEEVFKDIGMAFINALFYFAFRSGHEDSVWKYATKTREGRVVTNALKRDIDQSYKDYEKRVADGKKGGRPPLNP